MKEKLHEENNRFSGLQSANLYSHANYYSISLIYCIKLKYSLIHLYSHLLWQGDNPFEPKKGLEPTYFSAASSRYGDYYNGKTATLCVRRAPGTAEFLCNANPGDKLQVTGKSLNMISCLIKEKSLANIQIFFMWHMPSVPIQPRTCKLQERFFLYVHNHF